MAADPKSFKFDYSAIAKNKVTTYEINFSDFVKIVPGMERERMKEIVEFRKMRNAESAVNHYMNLKQIQQNIKFDELNLNDN